MSYVLDALRKIEEQEHGGGGGGGRLTGHPPRNRRPRRTWMVVLAAAATLTASAVVYNWTGGQRGGSAGERAPTAGGAGGEAAAPATPAEEETLPAAAAAVDDETGRGLPADGTRGAAVAAAGAGAVVAAPPSLPETAAGAEPSLEGLSGIPSSEVGPQEEDAASLEPVSRQAVVPEEGRLYFFDELPPEVKDEVGTLDITGHVYSNDRAFRLLMIGDQVHREGDTVSPGIVLKEITGEGAHFICQGYLFLLEAF